jgi:hypothetical protein
MAEIKINMNSLKPRQDINRHKIKEGDTVLRFLPPFGDESNGYPYKKWLVSWMLDPLSGRKRPYASLFMFEDRCPIYEYLELVKANIDAETKRLTLQGLDEDAVKEQLKDVFAILSDLKPKKTFAWNAIDKSGTVGVVELKATAHKDLCLLMNEYINEVNQDPTSLNSNPDDSGIWFKITRIGNFRDTEYKVAKYQVRQKDASGRMTYQDDTSPIPDVIVNEYAKHAVDLSSMYRKTSYEDLKKTLISNLTSIILEKELNILKVDGFFDENAKLIEPPKEEKKAEAPKVKAVDKPAVTLKLGKAEDESDDDLLAMADNILG